jgi:GAF domain-containing protein
MPPRGNGHRRFARPDEELRRLTTLVQLGQDGETASREEALLGSALTTVAAALPGHAVAVAMDHDGEVRIPDRLIRGRLPIELATLVAAVALDRTMLVERQEGDSTVLGLPLAGSRGRVGALVARAPHSGFDDADRAMLQAMARQLSLALDNLRLRRQLNDLLFRSSRD